MQTNDTYRDHPQPPQPVLKCDTDRESWSCKNMKPVENDTSMTHEHYECKICGRRMKLDYDEIR